MKNNIRICILTFRQNLLIPLDALVIEWKSGALSCTLVFVYVLAENSMLQHVNKNGNPNMCEPCMCDLR